MYIIKCWNSNPSLPQKIVSHSLRIRYAIRCWVDHQATQKALVGDPSQRPQDDECEQFVDILFVVHTKRD
ncbi:NBS-LRR type resistance protein [Cucumis melo var. makuwa]|uniref:NBS-LRR type resistance protein n=1 Tax=Cucumis melo var. makuwa TaxID=1194695 RepID=A0A5D3D6T8_CUCMM|nr:NBS-LRR type resistance protein [Cucumis melo var. makuwa]TYK19255.1 NBS-LRR type resistance protein [Cucumis melo var. makuwa]